MRRRVGKVQPVNEIGRRRTLVLLGGALVTGCSQGSTTSSGPPGGGSCTTPGAGPGANYCLVEKTKIRVPAARTLAVGEILLMASDDHNAVIVARDSRGLFALSAICTHACCTVTLCGDATCGSPLASPNDCRAPARGRSNSGGPTFLCPCHGSQFATSGKVLNGPATVDLPAFRLDVVGDDAVVDLSSPVASDVRV